MRPFDWIGGYAVAVCLILGAGCRSVGQRVTASPKLPVERRTNAVTGKTQPDSADAVDVVDKAAVVASDAVAQVSHESEPPPAPIPAGEPISVGDLDDPFSGIETLFMEPLISAVQARNPSLQAAHAAWAAAAERYPQAVALDDPMLQTMFAPASFTNSSPVQSSYYVGFAQKVPWHGKRELRGQMANWEAQAVAWDTRQVELRLANTARMAYFDYYLVQRELELNVRNTEVMQDFRSSAKRKYEANQVSQQDLSLADLELASLQQQRLELHRSEQIAIARINTLLHRHPNHPLPSPAATLTIGTALPESNILYDLAAEHRPELASLAAKIQSEQAAVALANKDYYPDFEFMARYDRFWMDNVQQPQVGMNVNVPLNQAKRCAAVREAQFRMARLNAEYAQQRDSVNEEVQVALSRLEANRQSAALFEQRILPAADANLSAARAAYIAGSIDFLRLMEARKQSIDRQADYQRVLTEYHRSRADLELAMGTAIGEIVTPVMADPS